jgi:hypothetical protein
MRTKGWSTPTLLNYTLCHREFTLVVLPNPRAPSDAAG